MKLRYTLRAERDIAAIRDFLLQRSPAGARNVLSRLTTSAGRLKDQPFLGIETDAADIRVLFVGRYPYKIFYRVSGDWIDILHVRHTSRLPTDIA